MKGSTNSRKRGIDPATTIVPLVAILGLCAVFIAEPDGSAKALGAIRGFLGDELGVYYLMIGLGVFAVSIWLAFSDIGKITLGAPGEKPKYSFFKWGAMIFTCGLAADILFYSMGEWIYYANEQHVRNLGNVQDWASTYSLFHWGPIPWGFYAVLASCFGFMLHVRGVKKQKYSQACRPVLGDRTDRLPGRLIDVLAVFALIAGTATTFSVATPLLSLILTQLIGMPGSKTLTVAILAVICLIYTVSVIRGMRGVSMLADSCMYLFGALLLYVFLFGGQAVYIVETGFSAFGNMVQNFIGLSTWTDALRETGFPQDWTVFYWAYWMVWCVASPFFMGSISRGMTVRQVILGAYAFGMGSTLLSFTVLGNYGLGLWAHGEFDALACYASGGDIYQAVIGILKNLPAYQGVLCVLAVSMVAFYATSFDSITLVACAYSYRHLPGEEEPGIRMKLFWAALLILLPVALIFSGNSMDNLQTVSIIAAFPVGAVIVLIIVSFIKDAKAYLAKGG